MKVEYGYGVAVVGPLLIVHTLRSKEEEMLTHTQIQVMAENATSVFPHEEVFSHLSPLERSMIHDLLIQFYLMGKEEIMEHLLYKKEHDDERENTSIRNNSHDQG